MVYWAYLVVVVVLLALREGELGGGQVTLSSCQLVFQRANSPLEYPHRGI